MQLNENGGLTGLESGDVGYFTWHSAYGSGKTMVASIEFTQRMLMQQPTHRGPLNLVIYPVARK